MSAPAALTPAPRCPPGSKPSGAGCIDRHPVHIECRSVRKALAFYTKRWQHWTQLRGAALPTARTGKGCPTYLLKIRRAKAKAAHRAYDRWLRDEYHWQRWLPRLWYAIGMCETHLDWHFDSGTYVSAFGIIRSAFPHWNGNNSPREQYRVALGIAGRYGLGAWGCYSHGGYRYHM